MILSTVTIRRPVFATVLSLMIALLGLVAWQRLELRQYPRVDLPVVSVSTAWRGASSDIMETQVSKVLEDSLAGIEGIDYISSKTETEKSDISVVFRPSVNPDSAAADVRDRVNQSRDRLPRDADEPIIAKASADATPIIFIALSSDTVSPMDVTALATSVVQDRLQIIAGVARADVYGARDYAMRLWLDPNKLAASHLSPRDVEQALRAQNIEIPAGRIEDVNREFTVRASADLKTVDEFSNIIIKQESGYLVRVGDVARVELAPANERVVSRRNGKPSVALGLVKQSSANPLEISAAVREAIPDLQRLLPPNVSLDIAYDSTVFIAASIKAVYTTMLEAIALVALVILFFLRSVRASIIPIVTIPVSLLGGLVLMYSMGFSINILTLLAFVLAVGLVVDDAIVMLENISRRIEEEGETPLDAALKGSQEIGFAIIAMTLTLAAVYAPIALAQGRTGRLFTEFALALAGAVIVSGFVALTLTPMLCSKLLRGTKVHHTPKEAGYITRYRGLLTSALHHRFLVMGGALASLAVTLVLYMGVPLKLPAFMPTIMQTGLAKELAPSEDQGFFIGIGLGADGATIDSTLRFAKMAEQIYAGIPEQKMYFVISGRPSVSQMLSFIVLKDWSERNRDSTAITESIKPAMMGISGLMAFPILPGGLGQDFLDAPVGLVLQTTGSWEDLSRVVMQVMGKAAQNPALQNVRNDLYLNNPELHLTINRDKLAAVNVSMDEVGNALQTLLGGLQATRFRKDGEQYDVLLQMDKAQRREPTDLTNIYVRSRAGDMVQLANVIDVQEAVGPRDLNHFNKMRSATITASLGEGMSQAAALSWLEQTVKETGAQGITLDYIGSSREFKKTSSEIGFVFLLALAFIYLVLAAQFESFRDPLVIMVTVPLAVFGALLALSVTGNSINIYTQIGLVTLVGLIAKNGILIVEFANQRQEQGADKVSAVIEAATLRLRPILMTTAATVLGAVPLALATGAGAESRSAIGWVIVGGMTIGTFFTLFVVPTVYTLIGKSRG